MTFFDARLWGSGSDCFPTISNVFQYFEKPERQKRKLNLSINGNINEKKSSMCEKADPKDQNIQRKNPCEADGSQTQNL